ncbi:MAG: single-stranded-DNA-specific exonuclease RecJ [Candidatus Izemoplasmatales bacterium]|nr:single-stranded-DNA-specific exonuclease RecJ [Candidatus Izemoplasmatales bacterium]
MIKSKYIWEKQIEEVVSDNQIFKTLLKNRNISDYETFFSMGKERLHNPFLLENMEKAVNRIKLAIESKEKIIIFGDYDCDGISSIALLYRTLTQMGAMVDYDLPDRFNEGYGLNERAATEIIKAGVKLLITVDNGITCNNEVEILKKAGIDTIITDHHEPSEMIPNAFAIIHPKLSPKYPFTEISGVMVAYKLASVLKNDDLDDLLDLVMVGTIADLMPLEDENQAMVNLGIERIKNTKNIGLRKLLEFSNLDIINVTAIAFKIAPKINSSGRLNKAKEAIQLLITSDIKEANKLILDIEKNHDLRKKLTEDAFLVCEELVNPEDSVIVVASEKLHEGVIGICAQRLVEKYQKSTIVITINEDNLGKGSARSFGDTNILEMLNQMSEFLERYGGHSQAAGLQINLNNLEKFKQGLNSLKIKETNPILKIDMEVDLPKINIQTIKSIQDKSFFTATYVMRNLRVAKKQILNQKHTKLQLEIEGYFFDALDFNSLEFYYILNLGDIISVVGGLNVNSYRNRDSLQIMIKDIECSDLQVFDYRRLNDKVIDYLRENSTQYNDDFIIENDDLVKSLEKTKTIVILPKSKKYNLNQIIDRVELGKIYKYFEKLNHFSLDDLNYNLYHEFILTKALKIFIELGLIEINDNIYHVKTHTSKMELNDSFTYQLILDKFHHINFIYQSEILAIKKYFKQMLEEK